MRKFIATVAFCFLAANLQAVEIKLSYRTLRQMIVTELFTESGRSYLQGDASSKCNYVYLEDPRVSHQGNRLAVVAKAVAQAAVEMFGNCIGAKDTFDVEFSGIPSYVNGMMELSDGRVEAGNPAYNVLLNSFLKDSLQREFRYDLRSEVDTLLQAPRKKSGVPLQIHDLAVDGPELSDQGLSLKIDFTLTSN